MIGFAQSLGEMKSTFALPAEVFEEKIKRGRVKCSADFGCLRGRGLFKWETAPQADEMRLAPAWSKGQLRELLNKAQGASDSDGEEAELREYLQLSYDGEEKVAAKHRRFHLTR